MSKNTQVCSLCGYPIMKHRCPPYDATPEERGPTGLWCPTDARLKNPLPAIDAECRHCGGTGFRMTHQAGVREHCFACKPTT